MKAESWIIQLKAAVQKVPHGSLILMIPVKLKFRFSGDYQVIALDENYKYALVGSPSLDYLWILSRTKTLDTTVIENLQSTATKQGFRVDRLVFIDQSCN